MIRDIGRRWLLKLLLLLALIWLPWAAWLAGWWLRPYFAWVQW